MKMILHSMVIVALAAGVLASAQSASSSAQQSHPHKNQQTDKSSHQHDAQHDGVNKRGDKMMGFAHAKTTHHFRLKTDGGLIEVTANDPNDTASRDQIRQHLKHIARKFAAGDFTAPMVIHAQTPPGMPAMQRLKAEIKYEVAETERGGRVRITSDNAEAIKAVHEFLRFQIKDHRTGDAGEVEKNR